MFVTKTRKIVPINLGPKMHSTYGFPKVGPKINNFRFYFQTDVTIKGEIWYMWAFQNEKFNCDT